MNRDADIDVSGAVEMSGFAQVVDAVILVRAQHGDMSAFAALYRRYGRACYGLALCLTGNAAQAEDLVQEVFLKLMQTIRSYRGEAPFGAWLKRLTTNAAIDQLRARTRFADADIETALAETANFDALAAPHLDAWALLDRLPSRARAIVVLHELEGYTHMEIGALFKQSESYSKSVLARALHRLNTIVIGAKANPT